jgi:hypothetical protein
LVPLVGLAAVAAQPLALERLDKAITAVLAAREPLRLVLVAAVVRGQLAEILPPLRVARAALGLPTL